MYEYPVCMLIYILHQNHLLIAFFQVFLIDTDSIQPKEPLLKQSHASWNGMEQIRRHEQYFAVYEHLTCARRLAPSYDIAS